MEFKKWLTDIRINKGLTQREFAKVVGITYVSICHYERGDREPGLTNLKKLSNYTGLSIAKIRKMFKGGKK